jgi:hypothetical protein
MGCGGECSGFLDCRESPHIHHNIKYRKPHSLPQLWTSRHWVSAVQNRVRAKIQSIYSIATTPGLNPLFPALTISISNISPHLRNIGVQASTRLMQLFKAFSTPSFLLADEGHPRLVYYLLETINSILYHQFNGTSPFPYLTSLIFLLSNVGRKTFYPPTC